MTRILLFGDLAPTGFGTVTADLGRELLALGEDVRFLSQNELGELPEPFASRTFVINEDRVGWHVALNKGVLSPAGVLDGTLWDDGWAPEVAIILGDFYSARGIVFYDDAGEAAFRSIPTYHYVPVEGVGLPPVWRDLWQIAKPVAMSEFGADQIAKVTGTRPAVVYHGVDTDAFYPVSAARPIRLGDTVLRSRDECKMYALKHLLRAGADPSVLLKKKVLLRTDTNVPRKQWPSLMRSLAPVLASHPDAMLVMHTRSADEGGDLRDVRSHFGKVGAQMVNTGYKDQGFILTRPDLNALINAADIYVSSSAEGFGLTIAEAVACGVPAVGLNYSAVPEVIGPAGLVVPARLVDNPYGHFWAAPDEAKFGEAVASLLDNERERLLLGAKGPHHVTANFSWRRSAAQFSELVGRSEAIAA